MVIVVLHIKHDTTRERQKCQSNRVYVSLYWCIITGKGRTQIIKGQETNKSNLDMNVKKSMVAEKWDQWWWNETGASGDPRLPGH